MIKLPVKANLNINALENMLTMKRMTNSYKLYWFASIFELIKQGNHEMGFEEIVTGMIAKCWYTILQYRLNLGSQDQLAKLVLLVHNTYNIEKNIPGNDLTAYLRETLSNEDIKDKIEIFYKYVPYRLLTPFYPELRGLKDYKKNKVIKELSQKDKRAIYKINNNNNIVINDNWFNYLYENQVVVEGWLNFKLVNYLQHRNPNVPAIPFKLSAPQSRNLYKAQKYWKKIIEIESIKDIYTRDIIDTNTSISIDHFIPWSFVLHDKLWNLVPTLKSINSRKSAHLPDLSCYLDQFCHLQLKGFKTAIKYSFSMEILEDFIELNSNIKLSKSLPDDIIINSIKETIGPLYQIAYNQGFLVWKA